MLAIAHADYLCQFDKNVKATEDDFDNDDDDDDDDYYTIAIY